jgi:putative ABC transport system permease protein
MIKNYFIVALRTLKEHKIINAINIIGLSLGFTCCFLINNYIQYEINYDKYQINYNNIYKLRYGQKDKSAKNIFYNSIIPQMGIYLQNKFAQIKNVVRIIPWEYNVKYKENQFKESCISYVDPNIFDVFSYNFISGDPKIALIEPYSVVISDEIENKYFYNENPIGKSILIGNKDFKITGVIKKQYSNTNIKTKIFLSINSNKRWSEPLDDMISMMDGGIYLQLNSIININELENNLKLLFHNILELKYENTLIELQPLSREHLYTKIDYSIEEEGQGDARSIIIYSLIAIIILIIAIINYIIITLGKLSYRLKEVGIRKVLGADKKDIIIQFIIEMTIMCSISALIGIILTYLLLPEINILTNREIGYYFDLNLLLGIIIIICITGIIVCTVPSYLFSRFRTIESIRGYSLKGKRNKLILCLVLIQFILAISFSISSNILTGQTEFMMNKNKIQENEKIIEINLRSLQRTYANEIIKNKCNLFENKLKQNQSIISCSGFTGDKMISEINYNGKKIKCVFNAIKETYFDLFEIKMKEGRNINCDIFPRDSINSIIVNETFIKENNIQNPLTCMLNYDNSSEGYQIIGVVEDFSLGSMKEKIEPMVYKYYTGISKKMYIKVKRNDIKNTLNYIQKNWKEYYPDAIMDYTFYDDTWREKHKSELNSQKLISIVSLISILLSVFGVFGMATMTMAKRTKEIGVRKVYGATTRKIVLYLLKDYIIMVAISSAIAIPITCYLMKKWLEDYVYRIELNIGIFFFPVLIILVIVLFTVSFKTVKAASANPVDTLKHE